MAVPVIMPKQGQSVETCIITQWFKNKGDAVKKGDMLFSYETDKASFDAEAEEEGVLLEVFCQEGDEVPVFSNVAVIGRKGEDINSFRPGASVTDYGNTSVEEPSPAPAPAPTPVPDPVFEEAGPVGAEAGPAATVSAGGTDTTEFKKSPSGGKVRISPRARAMATSLDIPFMNIKGTGPNGRIIVRDIEAAVQHVAAGSGTLIGTGTSAAMLGKPTMQTAMPTAVPQKHSVIMQTDHEDKKLSNVRKLIARSMYESITGSAQLTHHMSADVRRLLALRTKVKEAQAKGNTSNITLNDMVCFAVIKALHKFPGLNSHFLGDSIRTFKKVHLGLAVDTPRGLMVPVIQGASDYSLQGLSEKLAGAAGQCRNGNINPELLASTAASFTVSNLGNYGVEMFTPIINLPQVAILGVNTITYRPADIGDGVIGFIPVMGLSLTYDHRAVDGGPATLFLKEVRDQIEHFDVRI